jgi:glycosyltransferase involved in cell wall biosynthesis
MPELTLLVSTRNRASLLDKALASAVRQSLTDMEILVVDDASEDNTREVALKYAKKDSRVRYIRQDTRLGIAATWKTAFHEYAAGTFASVLNDDDIFTDDDFLQRSVKILADDPSLSAVFHNVQYTEEYPSLGGFTSENNSYAGMKDSYSGRELFLSDVFVHTDNGAVYRRKYLTELELFEENITSLDVEMMYKLMSKGDFRYEDRVVYLHRFHTECLSRLGEANLPNILKSHRWIERVYDYLMKTDFVTPDELRQWRQKRYSDIYRQIFHIYFDFAGYAAYVLGRAKAFDRFYIYGTGKGAVFLCNAIEHNGMLYKLKGFINDTPDGTFMGLPVLHPDEAAELPVVISVNAPKTAFKMIRKIIHKSAETVSILDEYDK